MSGIEDAQTLAQRDDMTAQIPEVLIIDGVQRSMACTPPLPANHPRIVTVDDERHQVLTGGLMVQTTACWRGYMGHWEIRDGRFYLVYLGGKFKLIGSEPLFADWFSGVLTIPRGECVQYVHMGFESVYEVQLYLRIDKGIVLESGVVDNRGKNDDELALFRLKSLRVNWFPEDGRPYDCSHDRLTDLWPKDSPTDS